MFGCTALFLENAHAEAMLKYATKSAISPLKHSNLLTISVADIWFFTVSTGLNLICLGMLTQYGTFLMKLMSTASINHLYSDIS